MTRKSPHEALTIMDHHQKALGLGRFSVRNVRAKKDATKWHENYWSGVPDSMASEKLRSLGALRAYLEIAGESKIFAQGIVLSVGRLALDKSVVYRLMRDGYINLECAGCEAAHFQLTAKGEEFLKT